MVDGAPSTAMHLVCTTGEEIGWAKCSNGRDKGICNLRALRALGSYSLTGLVRSQPGAPRAVAVFTLRLCKKTRSVVTSHRVAVWPWFVYLSSIHWATTK